MSRLGDILRERVVVAPVDVPVDSRAPVFTWNPRPSVGPSADLSRVCKLPRREATPLPDVVEFVQAEVARPACKMRLRPYQAWALSEMRRQSGLFGSIGVGEGKTLIALLAHVVMGARRTVILTKPDAIPQMTLVDYPRLQQHFVLPTLGESLHVVSYSALSAAKTADVLERLAPDLVVADEAHCLKHRTSARTRRFMRYIRVADPRVVILSGTLLGKSLREWAHLARVALGRGAPVPFEWGTLEEWAWALDPSDEPSPPGALRLFCSSADESVREGYRRRVVETPGVVATPVSQLGVSLVIHRRDVVVPKLITDALTDLRTTWITPGGVEIEDALAFYRYARHLSCGFYFERTWPNHEPESVREEWMAAQSEWHREVRSYLLRSARAGMDSPLLLEQAAATGRWHSQSYNRWAAIRNHAKPGRRVIWLSQYLVEDAVRWGLENAGIIWYSNRCLGARVAQLGGFRLHGAGRRASAEIIQESGDHTIVASAKAHGTAKNLQMFSTQLVTAPSSSSETWEQLLGREHRPGQPADEVSAFVYLHTPEFQAAFNAARIEATGVGQLAQKQRLSFATYTFHSSDIEVH